MSVDVIACTLSRSLARASHFGIFRTETMSGTPRVSLMSRTAALTNGGDQENYSPMRVGGKYFSPLPMAAGDETSKPEVRSLLWRTNQTNRFGGIFINTRYDFWFLQASRPRQSHEVAPTIEKTPAQLPTAKSSGNGSSRSGNCSALDAQQELHLQTWEGRLEKWKAALDKKAAQIEESKAAAVAISKANESEQSVCQSERGTVARPSRDVLNELSLVCVLCLMTAYDC